MLGAIVGDIVGSRFEFDHHRSKDFALFAKRCRFTDDSVMTRAVAKAVMEAAGSKPPGAQGYGDAFYGAMSALTVQYMREIGQKYPDCGYGGMFRRWMFSADPKPYGSYGNGAAMRVSAAGFAATGEGEAERLAETVTEVTHNHGEGIKGAQATAAAIVLARQGALKSGIRERISARYYPLDFRVDDIRGAYRFDETCQGTVPQAIACFLESSSFEDAIRTAVSLGGDSDTLAAITGAIAEAYYGVPEDIREKALGYLDGELRAVYDAWERFAPPNPERFRVLTKYIGKIGAASSPGEWIVDRENDGTPERPRQMPFVNYSPLVLEFLRELYEFSGSHPEYGLAQYQDILEQKGLKPGGVIQCPEHPDALDAQAALALVMAAARTDRFCEGTLLGLLEDGSLTAWLERLKDIDRTRQGREAADAPPGSHPVPPDSI